MSTMSQLGEFLATIQNNQDARTAALEERLATLEAKKECGCAETISTLEERLLALEAKKECGCAETISTLEERLLALEAKEECGCAETISTLEQRLATLEAKEECGCGSYDDLLASYEQRISALEGNTGGSTEGEGESSGSTEGEGGDSGSTEGEGEGDDNGSTEPIPASQALEEYDHLMGFHVGTSSSTVYFMRFISMNDHRYVTSNQAEDIDSINQRVTVAYLLGVNEGDIVKVYTPDLQEIEIIADSTCPYTKGQCQTAGLFPIAFGNKETKEVYCYDVDCTNRVVSPCTDEEFIAQWGNSDALGL